MCGRINVYDHEGIQALLDQLGVEHWPVITPRYNIAPTSTLDVLTLDDEALLRHQKMTWGIVPKWARPGQFSSPLFNARAETINEKPSFRNLIKNQRILVPVNGFYEWKREGKQKTSIYISPKIDRAMFLAGIYQHVSGKPSECCLITTAANRDMAQIHHRMPVITDIEHAISWLNSSTKPELDDLMQTQANGLLHMQVVSDFVNNTRHEGANCMQPIQSSQQESLIQGYSQ